MIIQDCRTADITESLKSMLDLSEMDDENKIKELAVKINTLIDLYNKNELKETANWLNKCNNPMLKLAMLLLVFSPKPETLLEHVTEEDIKNKYSDLL